VRAAAGLLQHVLDDVVAAAINDDLSPRERASISLSSDTSSAMTCNSHGLCVLDRDVSEPANSRDHDPFAGSRFRFPDALVGWGRESQSWWGWQTPDVRGGANGVLGKGSVDTVAAVPLRGTLRPSQGTAESENSSHDLLPIARATVPPNRVGREATLRRASLLVVVLVVATSAAAQSATPRSGVELYKAACAACHGADGRGATPALLGFDTPVPDFTDCSFASVEADADWLAVAHDGGPARAFDRRMPAFGDALSDVELQRILDRIRYFCTNPAWPRGELNMPRPLVTEKAFPENEAVWTTTVNATSRGQVGNELLYEQRLGARTQYEVVVPLLAQRGDSGELNRGLGDVALAMKHVLTHSLVRGHILSAGGELILPTGKESLGLGSGVTIFEPFVAFGQLLPADSFLQAQAGLELPFDSDRAGREAFWRVAIGKTFTEGRFGRTWSPMVEWLAARELEEDATVHWDVAPQIQVALSRRQHILLSVGVRIPVKERAGRSTQVIAYFLWDWFDGGLLDGWR
jgi:mono/diheme cytochrome c family protein